MKPIQRLNTTLTMAATCAVIQLLGLSASDAATMTDSFASRPMTSGVSEVLTGTSSAATAEIGEPDHDGDRRRTVWAAWTAPGAGTVEMDTLGSAFNTILAVYTGSQLSALAPVARNDDFSSVSTTSRVRFPTAAGMAYSIAVDGRYANSSGSGSVTLNVRFTPSQQPDAAVGTDTYAKRPALSGDLRALGVCNTRFFGIELDEKARYSDSGNTAWWRWVAPANGVVTLDSLGSEFNTVLTVYVGSAIQSLTEVAMSDDAPNSLQSRAVFRALAGQEYQIMLDGRYNNTSGRGNAIVELNLSPDLEPGGVPGGDRFDSRGRLEGHRAEGVAMNYFYGVDVSEPEHGSLRRRTAWWEWTAPADGEVRVWTQGTTPISADMGDVNTALVVYQGASFGNLQRVAANDDVSNALWSEVRFLAKRGTRYQLMVDGRYANNSGLGNLRVRVEQAPAASELLATYPAAEVEVPGLNGVVYQVQASEDLVVWENIGDPVVGAGHRIRVFDSLRGYGKKFYRYISSQ